MQQNIWDFVLINYKYKIMHDYISIATRATRWVGKNHPIFWKVAKTVAKQNTAKLETILKWLFRWKCNKFVAQGIAILAYFFIEPTKVA